MKKTENILVYDNSFNGFLSAIYRAFNDRLEVTGFRSERDNQVGLFSDTVYVPTDELLARKVWDSLQSKNYAALKSIYFAFLSETTGIEYDLYQYIKYIFLNSCNNDIYDIKKSKMRINQMASLVSREKQRLETEIQLYPTSEDFGIAYVEPAFNVLPLVSKHFRSKHKGQQWIIFDLRRNYGMFYNGRSVKMISSDFMYRLRSQKNTEAQKREASSLFSNSLSRPNQELALQNTNSFTAA